PEIPERARSQHLRIHRLSGLSDPTPLRSQTGPQVREHAQQGEEHKAYQKMKELEELGEGYLTRLHDPFSRGAVSYYKARVYAILGEKEKAVAELRSSLDQGKPFIWLTVTSDLDFASLKGYPPFEELIKPKG
ncbi:MAG: hypothetical protein AAF388_25305, partial [Bacteroidota bacterium]